MTDREKLIELMFSYQDEHNSIVVDKGGLADYLISNGVTFAKDTDVPSKWISVDDEKPKRRGKYFIAYNFGNSDMKFYGEAFWHDDIPDNGYVKGDHFSNEGVDGMYVTHWMHIPELPQVPKNGKEHEWLRRMQRVLPKDGRTEGR